MVLRSSLASPFGRKVRMAIEVLGLHDAVSLQVADTSDPSDNLRQQTPLVKVPALVLPDGEVLFDSRVIVDYLDGIDGIDGRHILMPRTSAARIQALRHQALADGLLDAALLQVYEVRFRPATHRVQSWIDHQQGKVDRALAAFEAGLPQASTAGAQIGKIVFAAALGYLDLRFQSVWRASYSRLLAWLEDFSMRVPAFAATAPPG